MRAAKVFAIVLLASAGCGGDDQEAENPAVSGEQRAILSTIDALQTASRQGDAARICREIFTPTMARSIRNASRRSCEKEVRQTLVSPDAQLAVGRQIDVNGSRATVTVREQDGDTSRIFLVKDRDRWRIERIRPLSS